MFFIAHMKWRNVWQKSFDDHISPNQYPGTFKSMIFRTSRLVGYVSSFPGGKPTSNIVSNWSWDKLRCKPQVRRCEKSHAPQIISVRLDAARMLNRILSERFRHTPGARLVEEILICRFRKVVQDGTYKNIQKPQVFQPLPFKNNFTNSRWAFIHPNNLCWWFILDWNLHAACVICMCVQLCCFRCVHAPPKV